MTGQGPPVLFIQGVGLTGRGWSPQVAALAADHTCIVFDNRGIGGSSGRTDGLTVDLMAQDALGLLAGLGIDQAHVVGHSLGGVIAQRLALLEPARVRSLALLCTFAGGKDLRRPGGRLIWLGLRTQLGTRQMRRTAFARLVTPEAYVQAKGIGPVVDELEAVFGRDLAGPPPITNVQLRALRAHDERGRLSELRSIPTLVVSARHDPIARPEFGRTLAEGAGAQYLLWDDASHALPIQQAAALNERLRAHWAANATRRA